MKLCRFDDNRLGVVEGEFITDVTSAIQTLQLGPPQPGLGDPLIARLSDLQAAIRNGTFDRRIAVDAVKLLSPVAAPTKLVCAPVNYLDHQAEGFADPAIHHNRHVAKIREVALFLKATSALIGPGEPIRLRHLDRRNDHELELAVIIGKRADRIQAEQAFEHIAGYAIGLDMTLRGPEDRSFRKSIDTYAVLGPWLVTADEIEEPNLDMMLRVNGELRQSANTRDLVVHIPQLIEWASSYYTLHPGDVLYTGTPSGVGPVVPGDVIEAYIEKIGTMTVAVTAA